MTFLCHPSSLTTSLWLLHSNSSTGLEKNFGFCPMFLSALSVCDCVKGKKTISFKSVYLLLLNWQTFANYIQCNPSKRKNLLRDSCLFCGHSLHLFFSVEVTSAPPKWTDSRPHSEWVTFNPTAWRLKNNTSLSGHQNDLCIKAKHSKTWQSNIQPSVSL